MLLILSNLNYCIPKVTICSGGGLCVKIFRRVATFDDSRQALSQKKSAKSGIELPKKSRTFVDQSLRERQNPRQLHQVIQINGNKLMNIYGN